MKTFLAIAFALTACVAAPDTRTLSNAPDAGACPTFVQHACGDAPTNVELTHWEGARNEDGTVTMTGDDFALATEFRAKALTWMTCRFYHDGAQ